MPRQNSGAGGKNKQAVISKFFAIKNRQQKAKHEKTDDVSCEESKKRTSNNEITQPTEKKQRLDDDSPKASTSTGQISDSTKHKLNSFAASTNPEAATQPSSSSSNGSAKPSSSKTTSLDKFQNTKYTELKKPHSTENNKGKIEQETGHLSSKLNPRTKSKYTPLEQQFLDVKAKHPDTILFVECGYKYRFFGDDAEIAAKELNIFAHLDHNFQTASIPTHRLYVHVRRLVAKGYKVGVVKQMETAALKAAGDNKSAPFTRELTALYTKSTLIGEDVDPVLGGGGEEMASDNSDSQGATNHLMCVYEASPGKANTHTIAIVSVVPSTGEIVYDVFEDGARRTELEARISHLEPVEILLPASVTPHTQRLVEHVIGISVNADDRIRVERLSDDLFQKDVALQEIEQFFKDVPTADASQTEDDVAILKLDPAVLCCLHALIEYLKAFKLDRLVAMSGTSARRFSTASRHLQLGASTVRNLELFRNATDGSARGSLLWLLDHTTSRFGRRLLRQWLARPLRDKHQLDERLGAVEELRELPPCMFRLKQLLASLPDVEKALTTIIHAKCSPSDFYQACDALSRVEHFLGQEAALMTQLQSSLLRDLLTETRQLLDGAGQWVQGLNQQAAKCGDKTELFRDEASFPELAAIKHSLAASIQQIRDHRRDIRITLGMPALDYVTVSGLEFMVEIKNSQLKLVPRDWEKVSSTKAVSRFHTPFIVQAYKELNQQREKLITTANQCWKQYLQSFEGSYPGYRRAVQHLAAIDCLLSLAHLAKQHAYIRPELVAEESVIEIEGGKHPIVDCLLEGQEQFVPNDTHLQGLGQRCMIVTGPNMGGKSSYIRQVALLCIMAQMGSFVPARSARLGLLDAVYTRMGAADEVFAGRSTFMVEALEAGEVMRQCTPRSLVVLDELGRGTSTHDGTALAYATARYFITEKQCLTLFVTHYPLLAELEQAYPSHVANFHMGFMVNDDEEEEEAEGSVTFLYSLTAGPAGRSYGLNVARLAALPGTVLRTAAARAHALREQIQHAREHRSLFIQLMSRRREENEIALRILSHELSMQTAVKEIETAPETVDKETTTETAGKETAPETAGKETATETAGKERATETAGKERATETAGKETVPETAGIERAPHTTGIETATEHSELNPSKQITDTNTVGSECEEMDVEEV